VGEALSLSGGVKDRAVLRRTETKRAEVASGWGKKEKGMKLLERAPGKKKGDTWFLIKKMN